MKVENWPITKPIPYSRNPRRNEGAIAKVAGSLKEFGWRQPIVVDTEGVIIAGHTRLLAAQKLGLSQVPVHIATDLSPQQIKAYRLADNRVAQEAEWDMDLLKLELSELDEEGFSLDLTGFNEDELEALLAEGTEDGLTDEDAVPEAPTQPVTVEGDVWVLGRHRLMCGDSTSIDAVEKLMDGKKAALLHADPPYGMGKEGDGIANDNLYREKLDQFQMEWWATFRTFLEDNASAYIWGNAPDLWRLWYKGGLEDSERMTMRNEIVWFKPPSGLGDGQNNSMSRSFGSITERCLFFMLGEQGFNNNADNYWQGWESIRSYLEEEMKRCGWGVKDLNRITGTQMAGHWVTKSQWGLITPDHYEKIQSAANEHNAFKKEHDQLKKEHDQLKKEHDQLKKDFYETRAYFDNTHDNMTEVWQFERVTGEERHGHATPKPVEMVGRAIKSSSQAKDVVAVPFSGTGPEFVAAEKLGRKCCGMELEPKYCDVIVKRWQQFTGKEAILESSSKTFAEVEAERKG